ncbi:hypothetical protein BGLA2_70022 [Burkholderia gladioli]|nr:hypothetical protein BGLA2_70022 [Burkholderia gladioli]
MLCARPVTPSMSFTDMALPWLASAVSTSSRRSAPMTLDSCFTLSLARRDAIPMTQNATTLPLDKNTIPIEWE